MTLDYLVFEYSEDDQGNTTWDAMASVQAHQWPALLREVHHVLHWACCEFHGRQGPLEEGGDWDFDLTAHHDDSGKRLPIDWQSSSAKIDAQTPMSTGYHTLTLTLSGTAAFSEALQHQFNLE